MARIAAHPVQQFRGTDGQHRAYTGPAGEVTFNVTTGRIHAQDGATAGGIAAMRYDDEPIGSIKIFVNNAVPSNWAVCNGGTVSTVTWPKFYALVGTKFGSSTATVTYVPNMNAPASNLVYAIKLG